MQSYKPLLFHVHIYTALTFELDFQKEFHFFSLIVKGMFILSHFSHV